jgi:hypothetical protein
VTAGATLALGETTLGVHRRPVEQELLPSQADRFEGLRGISLEMSRVFAPLYGAAPFREAKERLVAVWEARYLRDLLKQHRDNVTPRAAVWGASRSPSP